MTLGAAGYTTACEMTARPFATTSIWPQTEFVKTALRYARTGAAVDRDWIARCLTF